MELNEQQFIQGFNSGYLLAKHEPDMITLLLKDVKPVTSYIDGMKCGQIEYQQEREADLLNELELLRHKPTRERDSERNL